MYLDSVANAVSLVNCRLRLKNVTVLFLVKMDIIDVLNKQNRKEYKFLLFFLILVTILFKSIP